MGAFNNGPTGCPSVDGHAAPGKDSSASVAAARSRDEIAFKIRLDTLARRVILKPKPPDARAMKSLPILIAWSTAAFGLSSCGTMDLARKTGAATSETLDGLSKFSMTDLLPSRVKIVEVREKDLKKLPLGEERAIAYSTAKRRGLWFSDGPVDFKAPPLPEAGVEMDGSLLPPKPE